jgi:hypothetical protein
VALSDKQHAFVAAYLGKAERTATEAARQVGYKQPHVQGPRLLANVSVAEAIEAWREEVKAEAITLQSYRIARLADIERKYVTLIEERAEDMDGETAGGGTGLLVRQRKMLGGGEHGYEITEYAADTAVTKEIRETLKHAAQEIGDWAERQEHTGKDGGPLFVFFGEDPKGPG